MSVLVDTSVWVDHFRRTDPGLVRLLDLGEAVMHSFVLGELALGNLPKLAEMIDDLDSLPQATVASADQVLKFIADRKLAGSGIGYVDVHLLVAAAQTSGMLVWTRDKRLLVAAQSLSLSAEF